MMKFVLSALILGSSFSSIAFTTDESIPNNAELPKTPYKVDILIQKGSDLPNYTTTTLDPLARGESASLTNGGVKIPLKYTGLSESGQFNGKTTSHTFVYVTQENRFVVDVYRIDCGLLKIDTTWPVQQSEFIVNSKTHDCSLKVLIK